MAVDILTKTFTDPVNTIYPFGDFRDNPGDSSGTPWRLETMGDYVQWFAKMMGDSNVTYNQLRDNNTNGWQYFQAFRDHITKFGAINVYTVNTALSSSAFDSLTVGLSATPITITLQTCGSNTLGRKFTILNSGAGSLTVAAGTNTINPNVNVILQQSDSVEFVVSATNNVYITRLHRAYTAISTATNLNSWTGAIKYIKNNQKVDINGVASQVSTGANSILFNLPVGFRPTTQKQITINYYNVTTSVMIPGFLTIGINGDVTWQNAGTLTVGNTIQVNLDTISFYTEW